jgi:hypothetical protein
MAALGSGRTARRIRASARPMTNGRLELSAPFP